MTSKDQRPGSPQQQEHGGNQRATNRQYAQSDGCVSHRRSTIAPLVVVSRSGVQVVRDEAKLHPAVRRRFQERRRRGPMVVWGNGIMTGLCIGYVSSVAAHGLDAWTEPSTLIAVASIIFAGGQMVSARNEDRRRIAKLEETSVSKEQFTSLTESVHDMNMKIDRLIERGQT